MSLYVPGKGRTVNYLEGSPPGSAFQPGQAQSQQSPYAGSTPYAAHAPAGSNAGQQQNALSMSAWAMPKQQLLQWGQMQPQVPALQPQQGMTPAQTWDTISGVIGQVNNTAANQQVGTYLGSGAPPAGWGQTNYNPQQLWSQATDMVSQGWRNPFSPQPPATGTPPGPNGGPLESGDYWIPLMQVGVGGSGEPPAGWSPRQAQEGSAGSIRNLLTDSPPPVQPPAPPSSPPPPGAVSPWQARIDHAERLLRNPGANTDTAAVRDQLNWARQNLEQSEGYRAAVQRGPEAALDFVNKVQWDRHLANRRSGRAASRNAPETRQPPQTPRQQASRRRPAANPFAGRSAALPAGMSPSQFTRQLDGSYLPNGVTQRPSMTRRQPRVINWSEMTPDEIANTRSPYLGGRRPSINGVPVGGSSQPGRRLADVLQPPPLQSRPRRDPRDRGTPSPRSAGYYSPMPAGTPPSLAPFYDQAQQLAPGADPFQVRELAYRFKNMQP